MRLHIFLASAQSDDVRVIYLCIFICGVVTVLFGIAYEFVDGAIPLISSI